jgi:hypothetical protein
MPPRRRAAKTATSATKRPARKTTKTTKAAATKTAPAKRAPGRPRKLEIDPELLERIAGFVEVGVHPERAAVAAGISERTHYLWQRKGLEEREHLEAGGKPRSTYAIFLGYVEAIDKATALAEIDLVKSLKAGGKGSSEALILLERRFRDRWGAKPAAPPAKGTPAATTPLGQLEERRAARAAGQ